MYYNICNIYNTYIYIYVIYNNITYNIKYVTYIIYVIIYY